MKKYVFLLFVLAACQPDTHGPAGPFPIDYDKLQAEALEFESLRMVPLSTGDDHLMGDRLQVKIDRGDYFVLNPSAQESLLRFGPDGSFIGPIGRVGRGADEYLSAVDFTFRGDTVVILEQRAEDMALVFCRRDGGFIGRQALHLTAFSIAATPEGYFFSTSFMADRHSHRFYSTDTEGAVRDSFLYNEGKWMIPFSDQVLSVNGAEVLVHEAFSDTLYAFTGERLEPRYVFDFSPHAKPADFYTRDLMEAFMQLQADGFVNAKDYIENDRLAFFSLVYQKEGDDGRVQNLVLDKKTGTMKEYSSSLKESENDPFLPVIGISDANELILLVSALTLLDNRDAIVPLLESGADILDTMSEEDNPVILYARIND